MTISMDGRILLSLALVFGWPASAAQAQQSEVVEYYARDAVASIRIVFDPNGAALARQDYEPFGKALLQVTSLPKEGFGAEEKDGETDQGAFHARMFIYRVGRFGRVDPVFSGLSTPQQWNRYAYAANNPMRFVDYSGLQIVPCPPKTTKENQVLLQFCETIQVFPQPPPPAAGGAGGGTGPKGRERDGRDPKDKPTRPERDDPEDEPAPNNSCTDFAQELVDTVVHGSTTTARLINYVRNGAALLEVSLQNPWYRGPNRKDWGTDGVRRVLTNNNQGNDAFHHITFVTGASATLPAMILPFIAVDGYQAASGRAESKTELMDDVAAVAVSAAIAYGTITGDTKTTTRIVTTTVCK